MKIIFHRIVFLRKMTSVAMCLFLMGSSGRLAADALVTPGVLSFPDQPLEVRLSPPRPLGRISDSFRSSNSHSKLVILIQDIHGQYEVQKHIAGLLTFLSEKLRSRSHAAGLTESAASRGSSLEHGTSVPFVLAVEGASGPVDSSIMALYPDQTVKQSACEYLMRQGELSGAEFFAVMLGIPDLVNGVENNSYYQLNRDLFRRTWTDRQELTGLLNGIRKDIEPLRPRRGSDAEFIQFEHDLNLLISVTDLQSTEQEIKEFGPRMNQFIALTQSVMTSNGVHSFDASRIHRLISSSIDYYAIALMRNKPMVENTLRLLKPGGVTSSSKNIDASGGEPGASVAVLVAGGFHTKPMTDQLRTQNISYIVITPSVNDLSERDHDLYVKRLRGDLLSREEIVDDAVTWGTSRSLCSRLRRRSGNQALAIGLLGVALAPAFLDFAAGRWMMRYHVNWIAAVIGITGVVFPNLPAKSKKMVDEWKRLGKPNAKKSLDIVPTPHRPISFLEAHYVLSSNDTPVPPLQPRLVRQDDASPLTAEPNAPLRPDLHVVPDPAALKRSYTGRIIQLAPFVQIELPAAFTDMIRGGKTLRIQGRTPEQVLVALVAVYPDLAPHLLDAAHHLLPSISMIVNNAPFEPNQLLREGDVIHLVSTVSGETDADGALKSIGRRTPAVQQDIDSVRARQNEFLQAAAGVEPDDYEYFDRSFVLVESPDLPSSILAYHFKRASDGVLIVVVSASLAGISRLEAIYHELREDVWLRRSDVNTQLLYTAREAHVLASADQVLRFAPRNYPTTFHRGQVDSLTEESLRLLIDENEKARSWRHQLIRDAGFVLERVLAYEENVRAYASKQLRTKFRKTVPRPRWRGEDEFIVDKIQTLRDTMRLDRPDYRKFAGEIRANSSVGARVVYSAGSERIRIELGQKESTLRSLDALMATAVFVLDYAPSGRMTVRIFDELLKTLEVYNQTPTAKNITGPLSIPLLFSITLSPYVKEEGLLLRLIQNIQYLPTPFRDDITAFHLLQQGMHQGSYEFEPFDLKVLKVLVPIALQRLYRNELKPIDSKLGVALGRALFSFEGQPDASLADLLATSDIKFILKRFQILRRFDVASSAPIASIEFNLGTEVLRYNREPRVSIDEVLLDPWSTEHQEVLRRISAERFMHRQTERGYSREQIEGRYEAVSKSLATLQTKNRRSMNASEMAIAAVVTACCLNFTQARKQFRSARKLFFKSKSHSNTTDLPALELALDQMIQRLDPGQSLRIVSGDEGLGQGASVQSIQDASGRETGFLVTIHPNTDRELLEEMAVHELMHIVRGPVAGGWTAKWVDEFRTIRAVNHVLKSKPLLMKKVIEAGRQAVQNADPASALPLQVVDPVLDELLHVVRLESDSRHIQDQLAAERRAILQAA